jgi:hypothetical protein
MPPGSDCGLVVLPRSRSCLGNAHQRPFARIVLGDSGMFSINRPMDLRVLGYRIGSERVSSTGIELETHDLLGVASHQDTPQSAIATTEFSGFRFVSSEQQ